MKPFVAVKFTDGSHEIIPREWMVSDATCLYPPHKNINKDFIICNMVPDEDWKCYKIKILASAKTYERCLNKVYTGATTSSSETEGCGESQARSEGAAATRRVYEVIKPVVEDRELNAVIMERRLAVMEKKLDHLIKLSTINATRNKETSLGEELLANLPAKSQDELKIFCDSENLDKLLLNQQGCNIKETARRMIKRVFDKELAIQFSLTGLGAGRIRNKLSFIDNDVSKHILDCLLKVHPSCDRKTAVDACRVAIKSARDWNNGRKDERSTPAEANGEQQSSSE